MIMLLILDVHFLPILSPIILPLTFGLILHILTPFNPPFKIYQISIKSTITCQKLIGNTSIKLDEPVTQVLKCWKVLFYSEYSYLWICYHSVKKISRIMSSNSNANWVIQFNWGNMMHIHESFHSSFWGQWRLVWTDISGSTDLDLKSFHL